MVDETNKIEVDISQMTLGDLKFVLEVTENEKLTDNDSMKRFLNLLERVVIGGIDDIKISDFNEVALALKDAMTGTLEAKEGTPAGN